MQMMADGPFSSDEHVDRVTAWGCRDAGLNITSVPARGQIKNRHSQLYHCSRAESLSSTRRDNVLVLTSLDLET